MKNNDLHQLILKKLDDLDGQIREVRTADIPGIKVDIAGFNGQMKTLKKEQTRSTQLHTVIGAALAVLISKFTGHS